MKQVNRGRALGASLALFLGATLGGGSAAAAVIEPDFVEHPKSPIAEFRSNADASSWSYATGRDTQAASAMASSPFAWPVGEAVPWRFAIEAGTPSLQVGERAPIHFAPGLAGSQLALDTLAVHARANIQFTYDFAGLGSGTLAGDPHERFERDWAYLALDELDGLTGEGEITFAEPLGNQSASGVSFKLGERAKPVPEPAPHLLLGLGLLGLAWARRRQTRS